MPNEGKVPETMYAYRQHVFIMEMIIPAKPIENLLKYYNAYWAKSARKTVPKRPLFPFLSRWLGSLLKTPSLPRYTNIYIFIIFAENIHTREFGGDI